MRLMGESQGTPIARFSKFAVGGVWRDCADKKCDFELASTNALAPLCLSLKGTPSTIVSLCPTGAECEGEVRQCDQDMSKSNHRSLGESTTISRRSFWAGIAGMAAVGTFASTYGNVALAGNSATRMPLSSLSIPIDV